MKSFNVVITTTGRDSIQTMIDSIAPQLSSADYLTIIWDTEPFHVKVPPYVKMITIYNEEPMGWWGHGSRNHWIPKLPGDYIMNGDDDDIYLPDVMDTIRKVCTEHKLYIFKFLNRHGTVIPRSPQVKMNNIGTPCGIYPQLGEFPRWKFMYGGDGKFYESLSKILPVEFNDLLIYKVL